MLIHFRQAGRWGSFGLTVRAGWLVQQINKHLLTGTYLGKMSSPAMSRVIINSELSTRTGISEFAVSHWEWDRSTLKLSPSDIFPVSKIHILRVPSPPQTILLTGTKFWNISAYWGHFSSTVLHSTLWSPKIMVIILATLCQLDTS